MWIHTDAMQLYLTCSVTRLQPVSRIISDLPEYGGPWLCDLAAAPGPVTNALSAAVAEDLAQGCTSEQDTTNMGLPILV